MWELGLVSELILDVESCLVVVTCPQCGNSTYWWLLVLNVGTRPGGGYLSLIWKLCLVAELVFDVCEGLPCCGHLIF